VRLRYERAAAGAAKALTRRITAEREESMAVESGKL
jgi:hypothetical protein